MRDDNNKREEEGEKKTKTRNKNYLDWSTTGHENHHLQWRLKMDCDHMRKTDLLARVLLEKREEQQKTHLWRAHDVALSVVWVSIGFQNHQCSTPKHMLLKTKSHKESQRRRPSATEDTPRTCCSPCTVAISCAALAPCHDQWCQQQLTQNDKGKAMTNLDADEEGALGEWQPRELFHIL
jgi:hypothetical protein